MESLTVQQYSQTGTVVCLHGKQVCVSVCVCVCVCVCVGGSGSA